MNQQPSAAKIRQMTVAEIKQLVLAITSADDRTLRRLEKDARVGVRKLVVGQQRLLRSREEERMRMQRLLEIERRFWSTGVERVAGVDEVGRGCLAGPVVAAAVILPPETVIPGLDDSKRLSPEQREDLFDRITRVAVAVGLGWIEAKEIDRLNILEASMEAMRLAMDHLQPVPQRVLVDGNRKPDSRYEEFALVDGDQRSMSIAAASVVAKVERDRAMAKVSKRYPLYGFASHKGYGSAAHIEALQRHGPCPLHRRSFGPVADLVGRSDSESYRIFAEGIDTCLDIRELQRMGQHIKAAGTDVSPEELKLLRRLYRLQARRLNHPGREGERVAAEFLRRGGYRILHRRYRGAGGEIDLIARKVNTIAFVEVKSGRSGAASDPVDRVDRRKRTHLTRTARRWLKDHSPRGVTYQFDVIAVTLDVPTPSVRHYENAFPATG